MRLRIMVVIAAWITVALPLPAAHGHAGLTGSKPEEGARVKSVPRQLTLTFGETPTEEGRLIVKDGCNRNVVLVARVEGQSLKARTKPAAQPGRWKVAFRVVSAEDGHPTAGRYSFSVTGNRDCSRPGGGGNGDKDDDDTNSPNAGSDDESDASSFPWLLIALGAVGVVAVGFGLRRLTGS